jgi:sugar phosphate isomerase/epimerase
MQLGFVSAILGELSLEQVFACARDEGFACVELMCWPAGKAERRYAGVCHLDVNNFVASAVTELTHKYGVAISGLGYYPNPLDADANHRRLVADHLKKVIDAALLLEVKVVNSFIGRDHTQSLDANWALVRSVWPEIIGHAEHSGVHIGIENCPMLFSNDEWPGGKNLAVSPAVWRKLFEELPSPNLGLNFDPSHCVWQFLDPARCIREFGKRFVHFHAKDERIDRDHLHAVGVHGFGWHVAKLPGLGDVDWSAVFAALTDVGYRGAVSIEVEDRAYEGSLEDRKRALRQSKRYLEQFVGL